MQSIQGWKSRRKKSFFEPFKWRNRVPAFALVEALFSICLLPILLLTIVHLTSFAHRQEVKWRGVEEKEMTLFILQMDEQMNCSRQVEILGESELQLSVLRFEENTDKGSGAPLVHKIYLNQKGEIVKSDGNKQGFEPMLMNVKGWKVRKNGEKIEMSIEFFSGKKFDACWKVSDEPWE